MIHALVLVLCMLVTSGCLATRPDQWKGADKNYLKRDIYECRWDAGNRVRRGDPAGAGPFRTPQHVRRVHGVARLGADGRDSRPVVAFPLQTS